MNQATETLSLYKNNVRAQLRHRFQRVMIEKFTIQR